MTFQELVLALESYWAKYGCAILQPYDVEVGAGTMNPATFLRVLGPEPWNVAYVEPSRRPTDGRYGENPNRLQHYYQYQVILKPSPADIQEIYLKSLQSFGVDPMRARHPLRGGRLGIADPGGLGPRLGGLAGRPGDHPVHLLPAGRRDRGPAGGGRDHLRHRAHRHVPAGRGQRLRPQVERHASPTATSTTRARWSGRSTTSRRPTSPCTSACSTSTSGSPAG